MRYEKKYVWELIILREKVGRYPALVHDKPILMPIYNHMFCDSRECRKDREYRECRKHWESWICLLANLKMYFVAKAVYYNLKIIVLRLR